MSKDSDVEAAKEPSKASEPSVPLVPWKPWLGVIAAIIIFYGSQFFSSLIIGMYGGLRGWNEAEATQFLQDSVWAQFIFIAVAESIVIGALWLYLRRYKVGFSIIGLKRPRWRDLGYGLLAAPVYFVIYLISVALASHFIPGLDINQEQQIGFDNVTSGLPLVLTFISLVILPPITEEIMVRGFLYSTLKKAMPMIAAVLLTSAIFAGAHLPEGGEAGPLSIAAPDTFILSLVLIYLREKTGSLWASITLHGIKNGVAFVALFVLHVK